MGVRVNRIEAEYILKSMDSKNLPLKIHGVRKAAEGIITNYLEGEWVEFRGENQVLEIFEENEAVRIFFSYFGQVMTFQARVLKTGEVLRISYPKAIQKNLQRKYERVPSVEGSSLSFVIKEWKVELDFPKTEEYNPVDEPILINDQDLRNISSLMKNFQKTAHFYADSYHIRLFRDKRPETLEEHIIALYGKSFYLPNVDEGLPQEEILEFNPIISEKLLFPEDQAAKLLPALTKEDLRTLFTSYVSKGITALLYCPILYQQYIIGYIYLRTNRGGEKKILNKDALEFASQFSKILAYSLMLNGYFRKSRGVLAEYRSGIIDISAAGVLFAHPSEKLTNLISLYMDLELNLKLGHRKMQITSRVMRKFHDDHTNYYGSQFLKIQPEDLRFLFDYVYGRPFTEEEKRLWEGGMEPSQLSLN